MVADLDASVAAAVDFGAEVLCQHLGPEADAEEGLALLQRHPDPLGLLLDIVEIVVGALGATEDHGAAMMLERLGQRLAGEMAADVEGVTIALEPLADMARIRADLMQHQQNGLSGGITADATRSSRSAAVVDVGSASSIISLPVARIEQPSLDRLGQAVRHQTQK